MWLFVPSTSITAWFSLSLPCLSSATDKVALLIGNLSYQNHPQLKAPMVDVYDLTNLLRQLNFKVVSLLDLTESEMRNAVDEFLLLLHKGVYGVLGFYKTLGAYGCGYCFRSESDRKGQEIDLMWNTFNEESMCGLYNSKCIIIIIISNFLDRCCH